MPKFKSPFLEAVSRYMVARGYSKRTISTYIYWIRYFIRFLDKPMGNVRGYRPASRQRKLPVVLTKGFKHRVTTVAPELVPALRPR